MKSWINVIAALSLVLSTVGQIRASEIIINGLYHGENLLIQNPLSAGASDYCVDQVYVNDVLVLENPRISAVEIDLESFQLYEPLAIKLVHKDDCTPYLLNPEALVFKRAFSFHSIKSDGFAIRWVGSGEDSTATYHLDKAIDGLWTKIGDAPATGGFGTSEYSIDVNHDFGVNMYRVRYQSPSGFSKSSKQVEYLRIQEPLTFSPRNVQTGITLSRSAFFEVFDLEMNQITKGEGTQINLQGLPRGNYILILEGERHQFYKQ